MSMDLTGITNQNEYYTNHYFSTLFEERAGAAITAWNAAPRESAEVQTPWSRLRQNARQYYVQRERYERAGLGLQTLQCVQTMADAYLSSLGYPEASPAVIALEDGTSVPVYLELTKANGAPLLWVLLAASRDKEAGIEESYVFGAAVPDDGPASGIGLPRGVSGMITSSSASPASAGAATASAGASTGASASAASVGAVASAASVSAAGLMGSICVEDLATGILFGASEPPRFLLVIGMHQIALIDRNKWNEKRYLRFELGEIFSRLETTTLQAMAVLLHKDSLCPGEGQPLLDELSEESQRNASGVSQDLKYALRESIELLGNEVLYDRKHRLGRDPETDPVDAGELTLECLRYMYRMLFVLFIEARPELGYAPMKAQSYVEGYSLQSLRDIAENVREDIDEVGEGYYLHETLSKLYELMYNGYPRTEEALQEAAGMESVHDLFLIAPLKAHIFDPDYTKMIGEARLRNRCMLRIIDLMSLTRTGTGRGGRRGRISYANLGINQLGAVYEALLSYRGFIAQQDLYEVKRAGDKFNELDVGYFVPEAELGQYAEDERVRYEDGEKKGKLRRYEKGTFIYRLAGREREKSASYYTPEVLTRCLVKYALKELLEGKTADEILELTVCEPAMGSAAFLNEAISQLAEAYLDRKQKETGVPIPAQERAGELQKVKMYIADRNVYGIDLNPVAVELAEVSLWLNTIYKGGLVPWFGTQLVSGNSLIGARRQVYRVSQLTATSKGLRWYENAPERVPVGTARVEQRNNVSRRQVWHFLLGDPGMASYSDKVIKKLEPDAARAISKWNKEFTAPYTDDEVRTLLYLSSVVDDLWEKQVQLRRTIEEETRDELSVFGHPDTAKASHISIRQKDEIFSRLYKSEHMQNAGPYARLKFAMDYWCALWFWPMDRADLLPSRSEFLNDMSLILEGTFSTGRNANLLQYHQMSLFPSEQDELIDKINQWFPNQSVVDLDNLCALFPRLALVRELAAQNHFMHWELEFADLFADRGGFDLIIGNPPWIKVTWQEQNILSERNPMFAVKKLTAAQTSQFRQTLLMERSLYDMYLSEYESLTGQQNFLNASQNYSELAGQQTNLYKCFLPQAWMFSKTTGICAFIHPDGVFDDAKGALLRTNLYPKLRYHFKFQNELVLFDIMHTRSFSLNIYGEERKKISFDCLYNLYHPSTIEECFDISMAHAPVPGTKDCLGHWNLKGHPSRVIHVEKPELLLFAKLFEGNTNWESARLPVIHSKEFMAVLECFAMHSLTLGSIKSHICCSEMWHETNDQLDGTIFRNNDFSSVEPQSISQLILSGPHISTANPYAKVPRKVSKLSSDYDSLDLETISSDYIPRCNYSISCDQNEYYSKSPETSWGAKHIDNYRLCTRKMLNQDGERTLNAVILPRHAAHINGLFSMSFKDGVLPFAAYAASLPYDFFMKITKKQNANFSALMGMPLLQDFILSKECICRMLLLNCITVDFACLWSDYWNDDFTADSWSKIDARLPKSTFSKLTSNWTWNTPLRTDYSRRQALVELDVLTALGLGMTLAQLKTIYALQFPVLQKNEADTWYDINGRIVFSSNSTLTNVGFSRAEWEKGIKGAPAGRIFTRTIMDDTMPGGPIERTIEYVAPFDTCDREADYETAWSYFAERYGES